MARADLLIQIVQAGSSGNRAEFERAVRDLAQEERNKQHHVLAERLLRSVQARSSVGPRLVRDAATQRLFHEHIPRRDRADLVLPDDVNRAVDEMVEEQHRVEVLRAHGLEPRHRLLLTGPPGTGKTTLAEGIANDLAVPLIVPRYDQLIGSLLGETAERIHRLFAAVSERACVFFLDELDALAKERSDEQETGEVKRVVSSLLLQVDALPSHVVIVGATNHADLLDRAVWRRFELRLLLPMPTRDMRIRYLQRAQDDSTQPWGWPTATLADHLEGLSFAELEAFVLDVRRRVILDGPDGKVQEIVKSRLSRWLDRAVPTD